VVKEKLHCYPFGIQFRLPGVGTFYARMSIADLPDEHNKQTKNRVKFTFPAVNPN